ncbi:hypothetical protein [Chromohalobacter israelensis]|nr:hypothetical protein [Chromohalobacter salexigens]
MSQERQDLIVNSIKSEESARVVSRVQAAASGMAGLTWVGGVIGFLLLFVYLKIIGRSDIFLSSLELGPSLLFVVFMSGFIWLWLLVSLIAPSYLVSMADNIPSKIIKPNAFGSNVTIKLAFVGVVAWVLIILSKILIYYESINFPALVLLIFLFLLSGRYVFLNKAKVKPKGEGEKKWKYNGKVWTLWVSYALAVTGASIISLLVAVLVLKTHYWKDSESELYLSFVVVANMLATLLPAFFYSVAVRNNPKSKWLGVSIGVLVFSMVVAMASPSTVKWTFVKVLNIVGVSDYNIRDYYISGEEYNSEMLDSEKWGVIPYGDKGFGVTAIMLYRFGSISLLCPQDFPVGNKNLLTWNERVGECIPFSDKYTFPLNESVK